MRKNPETHNGLLSSWLDYQSSQISHHKCQGINSQSSLDFFRFFLKLLGEDNVHFYNTWYSVSWYYLYNRCMLSFHLLILPHHFQSQHFPGMRVGLLISLCVSYLGVQPTISHAPSSAKSVATPQHQMTHFLNSLGCKIKKKMIT